MTVFRLFARCRFTEHLVTGGRLDADRQRLDDLHDVDAGGQPFDEGGDPRTAVRPGLDSAGVDPGAERRRIDRSGDPCFKRVRVGCSAVFSLSGP
jgi:hypothetical protein